MANRSPYPSTPRWVKVFSIIAIVVVLLFVIMLLAGHGSGRHAPSGEAGGQVAASSVVEEHALPEGSRG
jgi:ABC-type transporter Mla subunit MlaD